jgi:hypothetical protein
MDVLVIQMAGAALVVIEAAHDPREDIVELAIATRFPLWMCEVWGGLEWEEAGVGVFLWATGYRGNCLSI